MSKFQILARFSIIVFFLGLISCFGPVANKWAIKDITTFCINSVADMYTETTEVSGDTMFIALQIQEAFVFAEHSFASSFSNQALALSLPDPGGDGIFEDIISLQFFADKDLNGIPAGEPINEFIGLKYFSNQYFNSTTINGLQAIDYWMIQMNKKDPGASYPVYDDQVFFLAIPNHPADSVQISVKLKTFRQEFNSNCNTVFWN